jgi:hypothetical protein
MTTRLLLALAVMGIVLSVTNLMSFKKGRDGARIHTIYEAHYFSVPCTDSEKCMSEIFKDATPDRPIVVWVDGQCTLSAGPPAGGWEIEGVRP